MMALLNSTNDHVPKIEVAIVLGEYRATEAVPCPGKPLGVG